MSEKERLLKLTEFERPLWEAGLVVAGIDEAGRGPLAGPVVAACVILPSEPLIEGIDDSKKLSEKKRESLYESIVRAALRFAVGIADVEEIERVNIRQATLRAMRDAARQAAPAYLLVDSERVPIELAQKNIVHGDALSYLIGAASIVAKVTRDRMMRELDKKYPLYGFARNKGYGTAEHIAAIGQYGLCPCHRPSFADKFVR